MTQEEKVRRYDEALERASKLRVQNPFDTVSQMMEYVFPELRESENERIKNWLIEYFHQYKEDGIEKYANGLKVESIIAWLEKQGEKDKLIKELGVYKVKYMQEVLNQQLEKQDEQKPDDMIESKFKVGEWVTNSIETVQITGYDIDYGYQVNYKGNLLHRDTDIIEKEYHLWTIDDAKDGDVLSDGFIIFIFKDLLSDGSVMSYCDYDTNSDESVAFCPVSVNLMCSKIIPATNEQRDVLFAKMRDVGYEWDPKKKELSKIEKQGEQKYTKIEPKFHEGEWLCENEPNNYARFIQILEIVNVQGDDRYRISRDINKNEDIVEFRFIKKYYHKFDGKDAKDGDVLYSSDSNQPFIYKCRNNGEQATCYCGINKFGKFFIWNTKDCIITLDKYVPVTKEQCDLLFSKMKEAGYEWDPKNKEVRKIEKQGEQNQSAILWHDGWEEPEEMKELLVEWESDDAIWHTVGFYEARTDMFRGEYKMPIDNVVRWMYVDELLEKDTMEEQQ